MESEAVKFVLVGDLHIERDPGPSDAFFDALWSAISRLDPRPDFVAFLGDVTQRGLPGEYTRAVELLSQCPVPWILVRGNHDKGGFASMLADAPCMVPVKAPREERQGRIYNWNALYWDESPHTAAAPPAPDPVHYPFFEKAQKPLCAIWDGYRHDCVFERRGIRFLVMDGSRWIFSDEQMQWLRHELALGRPTILLMHHHLLPVWYRYDGAHVFNSHDVLSLIRRHKNVLAGFHGHVHFNRRWDYDGRPFVTTGYRNWRFCSASPDGTVEVGASSVEEPPRAPYRHWNLAITGFHGRMFRLRDSRLWRFGEDSKYAEVAWAGNGACDQGLHWDCAITERDVGRPCQAGFCLVAHGAWRAQVAAADGNLLARREGPGTGRRRDVNLDITFPEAGEYRLSLVQLAGAQTGWMRSSEFALLNFEGSEAPPGWCWA